LFDFAAENVCSAPRRHREQQRLERPVREGRRSRPDIFSDTSRSSTKSIVEDVSGDMAGA
jgi:hypothetical protein